jgi:hypothetical protein
VVSWFKTSSVERRDQIRWRSLGFAESLLNLDRFTNFGV